MKSVVKKVINKEVLVLIATCLEIGSYGFEVYNDLNGLL